MLTLNFKSGTSGLEVERKPHAAGVDPRYELKLTQRGRRRKNKDSVWEDEITTMSISMTHEEFRDLIAGMDKIS